jgi:hypothetical protein
MGAHVIALAFSALLSAQAGEPQLVVLPLEAEGVKEQLGLDAWKAVVSEVAKAKTKLKVQVSFQKELHDMLLGPAREQARDCGSNIECLRDIGRALDCGQLIAGKVTKDEITLLALDVTTGQKLASGKSPANLAKSKVATKARAAAQSLIAVIAKKKGEKPGAVASVDKEKPTPVPREKPVKEPKEQALPKESPREQTRVEEPLVSAPPVQTTSVAATGKIRIAKEQLAGVSSVTIDGALVSAGFDGVIEWTGAPGTHAVIVSRNDGSRETRDVFVEADRTAEVSIPPPSLAQNADSNVTRTQVSNPNEEDSVTSKWWFWTAIATALIAGSATSVVLAGGLKGGPSIPDDTGTVSGIY